VNTGPLRVTRFGLTHRGVRAPDAAATQRRTPSRPPSHAGLRSGKREPLPCSPSPPPSPCRGPQSLLWKCLLDGEAYAGRSSLRIVIGFCLLQIPFGKRREASTAVVTDLDGGRASHHG